MTRNPEASRYGRCEATAKSTGEQCGRAAVGDHGKCGFHGGKSPKGEDHPNFKSGAWSKYADYDDDVVQTVEGIESDLDVLEELRDERLAQYYTILQHLNENEGVEVAGRILDQLEAGDGVDESAIAKLAKVMQVSSQSMDNLISRIQSLTNDIADRKGESPREFVQENRVDDDQIEELTDELKGAFGSEP